MVKVVKMVTLAFCSIQKHFVANIRAKFDIPNSPQSQDFGQNLDEGMVISGQSHIKNNFITPEPAIILT